MLGYTTKIQTHKQTHTPQRTLQLGEPKYPLPSSSWGLTGASSPWKSHSPQPQRHSGGGDPNAPVRDGSPCSSQGCPSPTDWGSSSTRTRQGGSLGHPMDWGHCPGVQGLLRRAGNSIWGLHRTNYGMFRGGKWREVSQGGTWGGTSVGKQKEKGRKGSGPLQRGTGQDGVSPDFWLNSMPSDFPGCRALWAGCLCVWGGWVPWVDQGWESHVHVVPGQGMMRVHCECMALASPKLD